MEGVFVIEMAAENFLKLQKVKFTPRPGVNVFTGLNAAGKSDVIRLFKAAFAGAGAEIITKGKDKATIYAKISDGHEIKRTITEKSKRCQVITPNGDIKAAPQIFLDSLLGSDLRFDPIAFALKEPREQKSMLLDTFHIGTVEPKMLEGIVDEEDIALIDFQQDGLKILKEAQNKVYSRRADVNKKAAMFKSEFERLQKSIEGFDPNGYQEKYGGDRSVSIQMNIDDTGKELNQAEAIKTQVDKASGLVAKLTERNKIAQQEADAIGEFDILNEKQNEIEIEIGILEKRLEGLKKNLLDLATSKQKKGNLIKEITTNKVTLENLPKNQDIPNIEDIKNRLAGYQEELKLNNLEAEKYSIFKQARKAEAEYGDLHEQSQKLSEVLDTKLRKELPEQIMDTKNLPFALEFDGDEPIINDRRISLMATSEQLMLGLQLFHERNKSARLKVICADRLESLDPDSYNHVVEFINQHGYQAIFTKVETAPMPADAILIEDGVVK